MTWGYIVDQDHQAQLELNRTGRCEDNARGRSGPQGITPEMRYALERGYTVLFTVRQFVAWRDDVRLYTGRVIIAGDLNHAIDELLTELSAIADANRVSFTRHPELDRSVQEMSTDV